MAPLLVAQVFYESHFTLSAAFPRYEAWLADPRLLSPAWEANPAGVMEVPWFKADLAVSLPEYRDADLVFKIPEDMGVLGGKELSAALTARSAPGFTAFGFTYNFGSWGLSVHTYGSEQVGLDFGLGDELDLGVVHVSFTDTLTAAEVQGLEEWVEVKWEFSANARAKVWGSGQGEAKSTPLLVGFGREASWARWGFGLEIRSWEGALSWSAGADGDSVGIVRPQVSDTVVWEAEVRALFDSTVLSWSREVALERALSFTALAGLQKEFIHWRWGLLVGFTPGFTLRGSYRDYRYYKTWIGDTVRAGAIDQRTSGLYAYERSDTLHIGGSATLLLYPDYTDEESLEERSLEIRVPPRLSVGFGGSREGEFWLFDFALGGDALWNLSGGVKDAYAGVSFGWKYLETLTRLGLLYKLTAIQSDEGTSLLHTGMVSLGFNLRSGPLLYGVLVRTTLPERLFPLATQSPLAEEVKTKSLKLPVSLGFSISWAPEEAP